MPTDPDALTGAIIAATIAVAASITLTRQWPRLIAWLDREDDPR